MYTVGNSKGTKGVYVASGSPRHLVFTPEAIGHWLGPCASRAVHAATFFFSMFGHLLPDFHSSTD